MPCLRLSERNLVTNLSLLNEYKSSQSNVAVRVGFRPINNKTLGMDAGTTIDEVAELPEVAGSVKTSDATRAGRSDSDIPPAMQRLHVRTKSEVAAVSLLHNALRSLESPVPVGEEDEEVLEEAAKGVDTVKQEEQDSVWERTEDEEGNIFWYNIETGTSQWEDPFAGGVGSLPVEKGSAGGEGSETHAGSSPNGDEWELLQDDATGHWYYLNRLSGESQWHDGQDGDDGGGSFQRTATSSVSATATSSAAATSNDHDSRLVEGAREMLEASVMELSELKLERDKLKQDVAEGEVRLQRVLAVVNALRPHSDSESDCELELPPPLPPSSPWTLNSTLTSQTTTMTLRPCGEHVPRHFLKRKFFL